MGVEDKLMRMIGKPAFQKKREEKAEKKLEAIETTQSIIEDKIKEKLNQPKDIS